MAVRANETYRVEGDGVPASTGFALQPAERATLTVDPSTKKSKAGGIALTVLGVAGLVPGIGVTVIVVGSGIAGTILICPIATAFGARYETCWTDVAGYFTPGYASPYVWGPAIGGVALLGVGITWLTASAGGHGTNVTTTTGLAATPPVLALPAWETRLRNETNAVLTPPPAGVFPILDARF
jgi:hypothetical protein